MFSISIYPSWMHRNVTVSLYGNFHSFNNVWILYFSDSNVHFPFLLNESPIASLQNVTNKRKMRLK